MARAAIAILDDDHINRLVRYAIAGDGEITEAWARDFFLPEEIDLREVYAAGNGLHPEDGVTVIPMSAGIDLRNGTDASILIFRRGRIDAELMDANPKLKLIQRVGERADAIDLAAAAARGIVVSCLPRPSLAYTAEHAVLLMLALSKRLVEAAEAVREDRWDRARVHSENGVAYNWAGLSNLAGLYAKTVGIIGLGEVGTLTVAMLRGFNARIVYCNRTRLAEAKERTLGVEYRPLPQLLAESDFVSLHASNLPENKGVMDASVFAQMKRTAFFINTSRGRMVDEGALEEALRKGTIAGAGLDVHATEPRPVPNRLGGLRNVIMTPHIAGGSRQGIIHEVTGLLDNCGAILRGGEINYRVGAT
jgi:lactate dehydrogenase-like 2-hydroxyacid dehydrogenase